MKITPKNSVRKHQMGGPVEQSQAAPAQEIQGAPQGQEQPAEGGEGQDPIQVLAEMSAQALQNQDCQAAMQVCQAFLEIVQQMQGGAPEEPQGEPVFRKGGVLVRRIKK